MAEINKDNTPVKTETDQVSQRVRMRNRLMAYGIIFLVVLFYVMTMVKISGNMAKAAVM